MGRIGDGDVHQAYVEFRAKDTDKVSFRFPLSSLLFLSAAPLPQHRGIPTLASHRRRRRRRRHRCFHHATVLSGADWKLTWEQCMSAQCLYCQSVRAKNTSRQRAHLLECTHYLEAMKAHNPESPILHEAINGTPLAATPTPASKVPKKRDLDTMVNGFQGDSTSINRTWPIPKPTLERDFQMSVQLNPKISVGHGIWGQRNWISYISGHWNGRWGKGTVVVSYYSFF